MKRIIPIVLVIIILFLFSLLVDRIIGFFGSPSEVPIRFAHPKNFEEKRKNIEYEYYFRTNSQGLRYKDIPLEKTDKESRIFMVGDSFTEGVGVNNNETFGALLEDHFSGTQDKNIRFINGGLAGTGPLQYWRVFLNVGLGYNINGLLICLYPNDLLDMPESITKQDLYSLYKETQRHGIKRLIHSLYPRTYTMLKRLQDQRLYRDRTKTSDFVALISSTAVENGIADDKIERWKKSLDEDLVLAINRGEFDGAILAWGLLKPHFLADALDIDNEEAEKKYQSMIFILDKMIKEAEGRTIEVALIYIPFPAQYDSSEYIPSRPWIKAGAYFRQEWLTKKSEIQKRLEEWTAEEKIPYLDLTPIFREEIIQNYPLNYKLDRHWNIEGNRVASIAISDWIEQEDVFSFIK